MFIPSNWSFGSIHQIEGPKAVVKNVMGAVKDISHVVWTGESFTTINNRIELRQPLVIKRITELKETSISNEKTWKLIADIEESDMDMIDLTEFIRLLNHQQLNLGLHFVSSQALINFESESCFPDTPMGRYQKLYHEVNLRIETKLDLLSRENTILELTKCVPIDERLSSIANGILTTSLSAGALYGLFSYTFTPKS